jgi:hypothetical protein
LRRFRNARSEILQYIFDWEEPCWKRKFNLKRKGPKLDVYGLNWILLKVYLNL